VQFWEMINKIDRAISGYILAIMIVFGFDNVLSRYLFDFSMAATNQFIVVFLGFLALVASAAGIKENSHVGLTLLIDLLPDKIKTIIQIFNIVVITLFFVVLFVFGVIVTYETYKYGQVDSVLGWPYWIFNIVYPIGALFCILESIAKIREL
jgi:C4-dicarboxylate transporter DctQ subunit